MHIIGNFNCLSFLSHYICFLAIESHWGLSRKQNVKLVIEANFELLREETQILVWTGGQNVLDCSQPPVSATTECKESSLFHFLFNFW